MSTLLEKIKKVKSNPKLILKAISDFGAYDWMPDEMYLKYMYSLVMDRKLHLDNPQTFNEKIQWLKLHDRKSEYTMMVDKYAVREYVKKVLGEEYLIPLLGVWDDPADIDFDTLPEQFVLKCNHNSGLGICICKDKSKLNIEKARSGLKKGIKQNYYLHAREWPYNDVPRKIIAEKYMEDESGELRDYKLMCFNGKVKCIFTCTERYSSDELKVTFFDNDWNKMPFERHYPASEREIKKPALLDEMIEKAQVLAKDIPFVRIDFYEVNSRIYFGEITLYPGSGMEEFTPEEWDYTLGSWLDLGV